MSQANPTPKKKEVPFMAIPHHVFLKREELFLKKKISSVEYRLLARIEFGTFGGGNPRHEFASKAECRIAGLSADMGYKKPNKIWPLLRSLEKKKLIIREKTENKAVEILGINPEIFGPILIQINEDREKKRAEKMVKKEKLRVVDKSEKCVDSSKSEHTDCVSETHESCADDTRNVCEEPTNCVSNPSQPSEIIEEKTPQELYKTHQNLFKTKNGETFSRLSLLNREQKPKRSQEEHNQIIQDQIARSKRGEEIA